MQLLLVCIGGAFGSIARYAVGKKISKKADTDFPLGTFIINISGAILLGLLNGSGSGKNMLLLLGDGFLGAYTTFSTFMYEGFDLFRKNEKKTALLYTVCSLLLGIAGFFAGYAAAVFFG